jgi:hypothetical protein
MINITQSFKNTLLLLVILTGAFDTIGIYSQLIQHINIKINN